MFSQLFTLFDSLVLDTTVPPRDRICDSFPEVTMTDQFGRSFQFRKDFIAPGDALVINTMYSTCRGSCPGTSAMIKKLRKRLTPVFDKKITFLSITLEPQVDTPAVLRSYAKVYGAGEEIEDLCPWYFLNTTQHDLEALRRSLGFFELNPRLDQDITQHASLLLAGNPSSDRWCKVPADLNEGVIAEAIRRVAGTTFEQRYGIKA
jgi:protein SCO1